MSELASPPRPNPSLARATSFRIGGTALEYYEPTTNEELRRVVDEVRGRRPFLLGGGCNTLFPDGPFRRPVISTVRLRSIERVGTTRVRADAGVRLGTLLGRTVGWGLSGMEGFAGIPGTVGGAVIMNAGGVDGSFGALVSELVLVSLSTGEMRRVDARDVPWRYRSWGFGEDWVVVSATLEFASGRVDALRWRSRECFERKRRTQPLAQPSAGCVFKNPPGRAAAEMIDRLGLKGLRAGGAEISSQHANFIVNRRDASAVDVRSLIVEVRRRVQDAFGVSLETELVLASDD